MSVNSSYLYDILIKYKSLRFVSIGFFNTIFGYFFFPCVYFACVSYRQHYVLMLVFCHSVCVLVSYYTNKVLVFKTIGNYTREISKFFLIHVLYLVLLSVAMPILVEKYDFHPVILPCCINLLLVFCSYFWYNFVTFLKKQEL